MGQCSADLSRSHRMNSLYEGIPWRIHSTESPACGYNFSKGEPCQCQQIRPNMPINHFSNELSYNLQKRSNNKVLAQQEWPTVIVSYDGEELKKSWILDTQPNLQKQGLRPGENANLPVRQKIDEIFINKAQGESTQQSGTEQLQQQELFYYRYKEFQTYPQGEFPIQTHYQRRANHHMEPQSSQFNQNRQYGASSDSVSPILYFESVVVSQHKPQLPPSQPNFQIQQQPIIQNTQPQQYTPYQLPAHHQPSEHHKSNPFNNSKSLKSPDSLIHDNHFLLQNKIREIQHDFSEHNIDLAFEKSRLVISKLGPQLTSYPQYLKLIREVNLEYKDVVGYASEISKNQWEVKSDEKNIKLSTCYTAKTVAVLVEAVLDYPIELFLSIINEINLHRKFIPYLTYSKQEKQLARNSKIGHCISDFPMISKREVFFQGAGYNRLQTNNTIFMYTRSIHNRPDLLKRFDYQPVPTPGTVMLEYKYISLECTPINSHKGLVKLCINADMQLDFVPKFMLEAATRKFGLEFFENVVKICKNFRRSKWEKAIQKDPELFKFYQKSIRDYLHKKGVVQ